MAKIRLGVVVTGIAGKVQGLVFATNGGGPYVRGMAVPVNPRTGAQRAQRERVSQAGPGWRALTSAQRAAWVAWAGDPDQELVNSLGEPYFPSGVSGYTLINARLRLVGRATRAAPPETLAPAMPTGVSVTAVGDGGPALVELGYTIGEFDANMDLVAFGRYYTRGGRTVRGSGRRVLFRNKTNGTGTQDVTWAFNDVWGTPQAGAQLFVDFYRQNSEGMRSAGAQVLTVFT